MCNSFRATYAVKMYLPLSELFMEGDLFSLGDFLMSISPSLELLDTLAATAFDGALAVTDWPSFKFV